MDSNSILFFVGSSSQVGIALYFIKKWIDRIDIDKKSLDEKIDRNDLKQTLAAREACEKIKNLQTAHHICRETLSERFADKAESGKLITEIFNDLKVLNRKVYATVGERVGDHE